MDTDMTGPVLQVEGLKVTFVRRERELPVVKGVSLSIAPGEAYGIVGESGCGKTTLALALMRYLPGSGRIDAGSITIDGEDVLALSEERLRELRGTKLAMVYQDPASALNPSMRIGDQIAEVYRFHEGLSRVSMPDPAGTLERYPFQLSGGQQQRVVIAMALAGDPRLLVLDEPTTGLDATVEAEVLDLIEELRGKVDAAILLISHNLGLVARLCERVGVMYAGRIVEQGPAKTLFTDPRHPYTMGLLRCLPRFGVRKDEVSLVPIPGSVPPLGTTMPGCVYTSRCELVQDVCSRREPDLYAFPPEDAAAAGRAAAEAAPPDPVAQSPSDAEPLGAGERHARCYFPERVPGMAVAQEHVERVEARVQRSGEALNTVGVSKVFKDGRKSLVAVDDVTIAVVAGETFGLVGESGSGKTTLARVIAGLHAADGGEVRFLGSVLPPNAADRGGDALRGIQMVFQNPDSTLNPSWSVRSILARSVKRLSGGDGDRRGHIDELARRVDFEPRYLENKPGELSGGQKQRVAIARAFAGRPTLVVCDEPASALDVSVQATILNLLADLQAEQSVSYIFISHDLAVVRYLSDHIGVMYLGWLMEIGKAEAVFEPPQCPYTEALVSAIPTLDFEHPRPRIALEGSIPSLSDPPSGCRFHTRCHRFLGDLCVEQSPPWRDTGEGHRYRCHIQPDELERLQRGRLDEC